MHDKGSNLLSIITRSVFGKKNVQAKKVYSSGYRSMHQRLRNDYGLVVDRETVCLILYKALDPEDVERRSRGCLKRRKYYAKGPNYIWHIDGYDKLKPFGFCIHGTIDGYSRRILCLEGGVTKNDPSVKAEYSCDCIEHVEAAPRIFRADEGTENCIVLEFNASISEGMTLIPLRGTRALCMDVQFPVKGLKLGGRFYVKPILIGRTNSSRRFGTRGYIATARTGSNAALHTSRIEC